MAKLESTTNEGGDSTRSALSAIAAGILVIIAGFLVYNYFSKTSEKQEGLIEKIAEQTEKLKTGEEESAEEETAQEKQEKSTGNTASLEQKETKGLENWVANDISPNTISQENYTVRSGDTLWEIAEGRYGSGFDWNKILEANKGDIGFLPNGSQALIVPGQVLTLPL